jgi:hypothetical protein
MAHEVEDLRLHGHIERGSRVVGDEQLLSIGQRRLIQETGPARARHRQPMKLFV